ncbi:nck-associated protein 5-like [Boleophthalmus pectinirostris]|uniref:nck-associated protein 5-like n=1 Tax=Boleophthalmus pectinirostris TaxID=150288 RepID=UPI0024305F63|nr:nck-associated protein 5-like [Boleophthalmus pectinirostris]
MVTLQQPFSSMEETVRTILQNQDSMEGPKVDPLDLMKAYKDKLLEEMWKQQDSLESVPVATETSVPVATETAASEETHSGSDEDSKDSNPLLERLRALEAENSALSIENDNQRKQYERCLDEVANQVVQALLTQKDLKEECVKLRTRVFDLEQQNRILSVLFQQRVKMAATPHSQDLQRNGKASVPVGRWPSLLSLTCPRSSGSDQSLSSGCSEYSSGSHTWAEGRGLSKQCGGGRDKRLSSGSFSSNQSAPIEPTELGWKEGHILKGLKRLQMCPKEASLHPSSPHCKDCMTSNEGIYSFGMKCGQKVSATKQVTPASKTNKEVAEDVAANVANSEASEQPAKEPISLDKLGSSKAADTGLLLSPVTDNFSFLPTVKPGVSPTDGLLQMDDDNSLERQKCLKLSDKNNNQEKTTDRKSRLDQVKKQQGGLKQVEKGSIQSSMSCSSSYHCPMNRSLLNNFLIEEGLSAPSHLASSSERLQSLKLQREQARRLQIEQQFSSAFGEPVSEEPERQSTITTIEEKVMIGIEENLHKSQEQERTTEVKQKSGSSLANWFGFRKSKLPAPSKKTEAPKVKEEKREQKITSLLGGKQTKADKKRERRKSEGKEISVTRREPHDAVRSCISMPCPGMSLNDLQAHADITGDPKMPMLNRRSDSENGSAVTSPSQDAIIGSGCTMRTLDSGIGTIPLPESCSFFSSILP